MDKFKTVDDILDFAINAEEEAYNLYMEIATKTDKPALSKVLEQFAKQELEHKKKLQSIKSDGSLESVDSEYVQTLDIGDYMLDVKPSADMDYEKVLVLSMKAEQAAFDLYTTLANKATDANAKKVLLALAKEEAAHKRIFEDEYEEFYLPEN